jgi:hypothetical protein
MPKTPVDRHVVLDPRKPINQYLLKPKCYFTRKRVKKQKKNKKPFMDRHNHDGVFLQDCDLVQWLHLWKVILTKTGLTRELKRRWAWLDILHMIEPGCDKANRSNQRAGWKIVWRADIPSWTEISSETTECDCETNVRMSRNLVSKGDITPVHKPFSISCQLSLAHWARPSEAFLQDTMQESQISETCRETEWLFCKSVRQAVSHKR